MLAKFFDKIIRKIHYYLENRLNQNMFHSKTFFLNMYTNTNKRCFLFLNKLKGK